MALRKIISAVLLATGLLSVVAFRYSDPGKSIYDFQLKTLEGESTTLKKYKGKKMLLVNVASKCGYTPQYKNLQALHEKYKDKVVVIGFPANDFGRQEPGNSTEIKEFCSKNYGVSFPMMEKISV